MKLESSLKPEFMMICCLALVLAFALPGFGQSNADQESTSSQKGDQGRKNNNGPGHEMGQGGIDIGRGAARGSLDLGKGVVGGAGNLVTGHPIDAGVSVGKGAAGFGKNVGVGVVKGTYKIGKGIGGEFKKLGKKSSKNNEKTS